MGEEWRPVVGFEGLYEVSSSGQVRSLPRRLVDGRQWRGKTLSSKVGRSSYLEVSLRTGVKSSKRYTVHRIVTRAFQGPAPEGKPYALHRDDDKLNNTEENLYWGSPSDNMYDRVRNGSHFNSKTECVRGHALVEENVYTPPGFETQRYCRTCRRIRHEKWYSGVKERRGNERLG